MRRAGGVPDGLRQMAAGAFFFSLMSLLVRLSGARLSTMEVVFSRSLIVLGISWALLRRAGVHPLGVNRRVLFLRGLIGFAALSCFYYALIELPLADATVIQYTNPVWATVLAAIFLSERIGGREVVASVASLSGVVVMTRPTFLFGGEASALPPQIVIIALIGAFLSGGAYVSVRYLGRTEHPLVVVFWFALVGSIGAAPFTALDFVRPDATEFALLIGVGVTTYLGQIFITRGLRVEPAARAMSVAYLQIVFVAVWGMVILAEYPDAWTFAGAGVVVLSTWLLARSRTPTGV